MTMTTDRFALSQCRITNQRMNAGCCCAGWWLEGVNGVIGWDEIDRLLYVPCAQHLHVSGMSVSQSVSQIANTGRIAYIFSRRERGENLLSIHFQCWALVLSISPYPPSIHPYPLWKPKPYHSEQRSRTRDYIIYSPRPTDPGVLQVSNAVQCVFITTPGVRLLAPSFLQRQPLWLWLTDRQTDGIILERNAPDSYHTNTLTPEWSDGRKLSLPISSLHLWSLRREWWRRLTLIVEMEINWSEI